MRDINHHHVFGSQDFVGMVLIKIFSCRVPGDRPLIPKNIKLKKPWKGGGGRRERGAGGEERAEAHEDPRIAVGKEQCKIERL